MPTYVVTAPDGKEYEIEGSGSQEQALAEFQRQWSAKGGLTPPAEQSLEDKYSLVPQSLRDVQRVVMDSVTRGFGDKIEGEAAQQRTAAARERLPGVVETPADVVGAVVGAPYRVGSVAGGALAGGLEGAVSAYGNQKDWVPDSQGMWDIGKGAVLGTGLGAAGTKFGEWLGGRLGSTTTPGTVAPAAARKADNIQRIFEATGGDREAFARALAAVGYDASQFTDAPALQAAAQKAGDIVSGGGNPVVGAGLAMLTGGKSTAAGAALQAGAKYLGRGSTISQPEIDAALNAIRSPSGGSVSIDPAIVDKWRDLFAKTGIGAGRSQ